MSVALLETMKQQVNALTKQQQAELAQFLLKQIEQDAAVAAEQSAPPGELAAAEAKRLR